MKIILLQDIKNVGKKNQVLELSDGYVRNFILPKKLGVEAKDSNMKILNNNLRKIEEQKQNDIKLAQELKSKLEKLVLLCEIKSGENGKTFGSVTLKEIADKLLSQYDISIDKKKISLEDPIKSKGSHNIQIKLHDNISANLKVQVI